MWDPVELVTLAGDALRRLDLELAAEQAVHGVDALHEVGLHPVLADGLRAGGFGVWREVAYPSPRGTRRLLRDRERCDLVLTPSPEDRLADPVEDLSWRERERGTLLESLAGSALGPRLDPGDAFWLEVKVVGQHAYQNSIPGPNPTFASELGRCAQDLEKLAGDERIRRAGLLLVVFAESEEAASHDTGVLIRRWLDEDYDVGVPAWKTVPIRERILNRVAHLMLTPLRAARGPA